MPSVVHIITTNNFAGAERYVCTTAEETAGRGWKTTVVGGDPTLMQDALPVGVRWMEGGTATESFRSLRRLGRQDVCHAHMTYAETVGIATRFLHRAPVISTRHFAAPRGASRIGHLAAPLIAKHLSRQIAISKFVAARLEAPPDAVIPNAVAPSPCLWLSTNRAVLVLQRLEREKDTLTALKAWRASRLAEEGWTLRVVGAGSERRALEGWNHAEGVESVAFAGWTRDVAQEFGRAGMLLASAPAEPFGLSVVEAMAAGVPVVAAAAGGHLETAGLLPGAVLFTPGDADQAAAGLRSLVSGEARTAASAAGRELVEQEFTVAHHVDRLLVEYDIAINSRAVSKTSGGLIRPVHRVPSPPKGKPLKAARNSTDGGALTELVVCSLEPWDDVWRRNQFFTDILLQRNPGLRVLFVEPPADPLFDLASRRLPTLPRFHTISADGRLHAFRPLKPLPRRIGPAADGLIRAQVATAVKLLGFTRPVLWINDVTFAPLIASTGWATVYDVTDDWLLAPFSERELERLRRLDSLALASADEVVVCSPALAESRGSKRAVSLIPNGVDVEHFRRPRSRPRDLPMSPVAVYAGTLHEARLDVDLVVELARSNPNTNIALLGPNALDADSQSLIGTVSNVILLGPRPYAEVPGYLQNADVIIVPHRISPFTESLDPIKAYECLAIDTPTVATPVAGFRELSGALRIADRKSFVQSVTDVLSNPVRLEQVSRPPEWGERASLFEEVLRRASHTRTQGRAPDLGVDGQPHS